MNSDDKGFIYNQRRDASAAIRGFVYQVEVTLLRWLNLTGEGYLHLEAGEDVDEICLGVRRNNIQIKHQREAVTLTSTRAFLARSFSLCRENPSWSLTSQFCTTAPAGREVGHPFDGPGVIEWNRFHSLSTGAADEFISRLRSYFKSLGAPAGCPPPVWDSFQAFIVDSPAAHVGRFIGSVSYSFEYASSANLKATCLKRLRQYFVDPETGYERLFCHIFKTLAASGPKVLRSAELIDVLERRPSREERLNYLLLLAQLHTHQVRIEHLEKRVAILESGSPDPNAVIAGTQGLQLASEPHVREQVVLPADPFAHTGGDLCVDSSFHFHESLPLIGREEELTALTRAIDNHRLVTLHGPGGVGKTRLSMDFVKKHTESRLTAVVPLIACKTKPSVVLALREAVLGKVDTGHQDPLDIIVQSIGNRELLIVFDNCEHVLAHCRSIISSLLRRCPRLKILATSQTVLGISSETRIELAPLATTKAVDREPEISPAAELFIFHALRTRSSFVPSASLLAEVERLCTILAGLPLAIELAASALIAFTPSQLIQAKENLYGLLEVGDATKPPKERALSSCFQWSYRLLSVDEQRMLRLVCVFAEGWSMADAQELSHMLGHSHDVKQLVLSLSRRSFLQLSPYALNRGGSPSEVLYAVLPPLRHFGEEYLRQSGEDSAAYRSFVDLCKHRAASANRKLDSMDAWRAINELDENLPNIRKALDLSRETSDGLTLANSMGRFWEIRGYYREAAYWLQEILDSNGEADSTDKASALRLLATMHYSMGDYDKALSAADASIDQGNVPDLLVASAKATRGLILNKLGQVHRAETEMIEALNIRIKLGDDRGVGSSLGNLGRLCVDKGDLRQAFRLYKRSYRVRHEVGYARGIADCLTQLGLILHLRGRDPFAMILLREAAGIERKLGNMRGEAIARRHLARTFLAQRRTDECRGELCHAIFLSRQVGDRGGISASAFVAAKLMERLGKYHEAMQLLAISEVAMKGRKFLRPRREREEFLELKSRLLTKGSAFHHLVANSARNESVEDVAEILVGMLDCFNLPDATKA